MHPHCPQRRLTIEESDQRVQNWIWSQWSVEKETEELFSCDHPIFQHVRLTVVEISKLLSADKISLATQCTMEQPTFMAVIETWNKIKQSIILTVHRGTPGKAGRYWYHQCTVLTGKQIVTSLPHISTDYIRIFEPLLWRSFGISGFAFKNEENCTHCG